MSAVTVINEPTVSITFSALAIDNDIDPDLLTTYADSLGFDDPEEAFDHFQDNYAGIWDDLEAWAIDMLEQTGELEEMPERLRYYFNYQAYAYDCQLGGDIWTLDTSEGIAVFWNR
jgi:antirestriction protein